MPYFGSTIEGAANTAWQADNSIRDRLINNAWRMRDANERNRAMEIQDQQAQLAAMRMADDDAARQYFMGLNAMAEAARMQRAIEAQKAQEEAMRRAQEMNQEQLKMQREQFELQKGLQEKSESETEQARRAMPELLAQSYFGLIGETQKIGEELDTKRSQLAGYIDNARRLGGYFDPLEKRLVIPKTIESQVAKEILPKYSSKINLLMADIENTSRKLAEMQRQLSELNANAIQMGFVFSGVEDGNVGVRSIYPNVPRSIQVRPPSTNINPAKRYIYDPTSKRLIPR